MSNPVNAEKLISGIQDQVGKKIIRYKEAEAAVLSASDVLAAAKAAMDKAQISFDEHSAQRDQDLDSLTKLFQFLDLDASQFDLAPAAAKTAAVGTAVKEPAIEGKSAAHAQVEESDTAHTHGEHAAGADAFDDATDAHEKAPPSTVSPTSSATPKSRFSRSN